MATLKYVGAPAQANSDLVYRDYLDIVKQADLTQAQVDSVINDKLAGYASVAYVDTQDAKLATQAYIDAQDNLRIRTSSKNISGGVPGLSASGRVDPQKISASTLSQNWHRGIWSPGAYNAAPVSATTTEVNLYTCSVTDPGYPYRLIVFGLADARTGTDAEYPVVRVRAGSETGEIIAQGNGHNDAMETDTSTGDQFGTNYTNGLGPDWTVTNYENTGTAFITVASNEARWGGGDVNAESSMRARRTKITDWHTGTDFQRIDVTTGTVAGQDPAGGFGGGTPQYLRIYARMNNAGDQYVLVQIPYNGVPQLFYCNGGDPNAPTQVAYSGAAVSQTTNTKYSLVTGTPANPRTFYLYKADALVATIPGGEDSAMGPNNRGWGWGVRAGKASVFGSQIDPPSVTSISVTDAVQNYGTINIVPRRLDVVPVMTGATTLHINLLRSGTAATATATIKYPKLSVMAAPA